ncbi:MAG: hypothetical protein ACI8PZ_004696 [Myxococcota bacterium]
MSAPASTRRTRICLALLTLACGVGSSASAAEVTDLPPERGALVRLSYEGTHTTGGLEEEGERISERRVTRHDLFWQAEVSPARGLAANIGLEHSAGFTFRYPDARPMIFEPTTGAGTYLFSRPNGDAEVDAAGVTGVWLGLAATPYSELFDKQHLATWRFDVALRPGSPKRNLWTAKNGKRGPAPGGTGIRLAGAFSRDLGVGNPYMQFEYLHEGAVTVDLEDEEGKVYARRVELKPASTVEVTGGVEIVAWRQAETGQRASADLSLTAGYRTWQDVGSGVLLPNVLDGSRQIAITEGEAIYVRGRIGADVHAMDAVRTRLGATLGWQTPTRPEHVYQVTTTPGTVTIGWFLTVEGRAPFSDLFGAAESPPPVAPDPTTPTAPE